MIRDKSYNINKPKLPKFDIIGDDSKGFQSLMQYRVKNILLVASLYDSFNLFEDAQLTEMLLTEFLKLKIFHAPTITRVSTGSKALKLIRAGNQFDLVITSISVGRMNVINFARKLKKNSSDLPLILLSHDTRQLNELREDPAGAIFDKIFLWQGDFHVLIAIIKFIEDRLNVEHDTLQMGVQIILLIEDNLKFYSTFLPMIYTEVMKHSHSLITEGVNKAHKMLRMRARPKILWCETFEEAWEYFERYEKYVLGVITDVEFPRNGVKDSKAGAKFARRVKATRSDIPVVLQSFQKENATIANDLSVGFIQKDSPDLLKQLRNFMKEHLGFGDFIFCLPNRRITGRWEDYLSPNRRAIDSANDLRSLERKIADIPDESLIYHCERNHFSTWLKARTEFDLAAKLRPRRVADYNSTGEMRSDIISHLQIARHERNSKIITDFNPQSFDATISFSKVGSGSLGGKARGLAFISHFINHYKLDNYFPNVKLTIPQTLVICTDIFDKYMEDNGLFSIAIQSDDDAEINIAFQKAELPSELIQYLNVVLKELTVPLAVRSSSILEDSQYQPFAGVYSTFMIPNNDTDFSIRLNNLVEAIKRIYASVYYNASKQYMALTPYRLEEEKMAIIIQRLVGVEHNGRFYPDISGVANSHNYYPAPPATHQDGTASIALGLGQLVVDGGETIKFSPKFPEHLGQYSSVKNMIDHSQRNFYALDLNEMVEFSDSKIEPKLSQYPLEMAELDGTLYNIGSVYSPDNNVIYDGISRPGIRLVSFAPILKFKSFPLAEILSMIIESGGYGMAGPVEIEFAVNLSVASGAVKEFAVLQMRPMALDRETEVIEIPKLVDSDLICYTDSLLGVGSIDNIQDILLVDIHQHDRSQNSETALEIERFNNALTKEKLPYILIGVGRWGSSDPWLGIPVNWDQISGVRVIIETSFADLVVEPSQGSHFFHNITAFSVGYFSIKAESKSNWIDWVWLSNQPVHGKGEHIRHLRFANPIIVKMNSYKNQGVIYKPK